MIEGFPTLRRFNCLQDCNALCCKDMIFDGCTKEQAEAFKDKGGQRVTLTPQERLLRKPDYRISFRGSCPFLLGKYCTLKDNPLRPKICGEYQMGGYSCLKLRLDRGLTSPEQFNRERSLSDANRSVIWLLQDS